jgi:hypothetical protein
MSWWIFIPILVALFYLAIPLLIWKTMRLEATPTIQRIDPAELPLPETARQHLDTVDAELRGLGFESRATLLLPSATPNVISLLRVFVNPTQKCSAMANSMISRVKTESGEQVRHHPYVEFTTRYQDGQVFNTNNSAAGGSFPPAPQSQTTRVPWIQHVPTVHLIHDAITTAKNGAAQKVLRLDESFAGDEVAYLQACMKEEFENATKAGYLWLRRDGTAYLATVRGAYLMTWKELPPIKQWLAWRRRARAERLLREVGAG